MEQKISYYSTPVDTDVTGTDDFETMVIKANRHNRIIIQSYSDIINQSDKTINSYAKMVFNYESENAEYVKLLRQLTQIRAIYLTAISHPVDLGCKINDEENYIQTAYDKMTSHIKTKIELVDGYIEIVGQHIEKIKAADKKPFDDKNIFTLEFLLALHKEFNTTLFDNTFDDIRYALNDPENIDYTITFKKTSDTICYYFINQLNLKGNYSNFEALICKKQGFDYVEKYKRKKDHAGSDYSSKPDKAFKKKYDAFDKIRIK